MTRENIVKTVNDLLIEEFEIEEKVISPNAHLKDDLGLESLDFVDIAVVVQKEFGLVLKGEDMASITTLHNLYEHIFNCVQKKA